MLRPKTGLRDSPPDTELLAAVVVKTDREISLHT